MLQRFLLNNFKALKNASINIKPITILVGKNSSGKSSFLQGLLLLKQTAESRDPWAPLVPRGAHVDLGTYEDFVYGHQPERDISFEIDLLVPYSKVKQKFTEPWEPQRFYMFKQGFYSPLAGPRFFRSPIHGGPELLIRLAATFSYSHFRKRTVLKELHYAFGNEKPTLKVKGKGKGFFEHDVSVEMESGRRRVRVTFERCRIRKFYEPNIAWGKKPSVKPLSGPTYKTKRHELADRARRYVDSLVSIVSPAVDELVKSLIHLGPIREAPRRTYIASGETRTEVGLRGESAVEMLYDDIVAGDKKTHENTKRIGRVQYWLNRLEMASAFAFPDLAGAAFLFKPQNPSNRLKSNIVDHGFGLSQTLPVIVQGFYANPGSVLLLEQPEIHLHPKAQADLGDLLVEISKRGITVIAETHSEHLVERLQRLVGENKVSADTLSILLFDISDDGSRVRKLELTEHGKRLNWPEDFADGFFNSGLLDAIRQQKSIRAKIKCELATGDKGIT